MERLKQIVGRLQAIDQEQASIDAEAEKAGGVMTDEQRAKYAALDTEANALVSEKETLVADEQRKAARAARRSHLTVPTITSGRQLEHDSNEPLEQASTRTAIPSWVKRSGRQLKAFQGEQDGMKAEERAYRFGMFCRALVGAQNPRLRSKRAEAFAEKEWGDVQNAAHGETDAFGSEILVPEEFSNDMIDLRLRYGVARRLFRVRKMNRDTLRVSRRGDELEASFVGENAVIPEDNVTWDDVMLVAKKLGVIARWSNELDEDAIIDLGDYLADSIGYAFAKKEDQCCLIGDGTSTYGGIVGLVTKLQDVDGAGADSIGVIAQGTGNTLAAMVLSDFVKVPGYMPDYAAARGDGLKWLMNRMVYHTIVGPLMVSGGNPTWADIQGRMTPMLGGYPVEFTNVLPSTTAVSTIFALFGDFNAAGTFGDRRQETISFSEHATVGGESVWQRDQIAIRGTERFDFLAHDVGSASVYGPVVALRTGS
jgi:HK97 family phage major capsid protein